MHKVVSARSLEFEYNLNNFPWSRAAEGGLCFDHKQSK